MQTFGPSVYWKNSKRSKLKSIRKDGSGGKTVPENCWHNRPTSERTTISFLEASMRKGLRTVIRLIGWCARGLVAGFVAASIAGLIIYKKYEDRAAQYDLTKIGEVPQRSAVFDVNGQLYSYIHGENRLVVPLGQVSQYFLTAL